MLAPNKLKKSVIDISETVFDSLKAAQYGADEYGMKKYIMAYLKRGPNRDQDSATAARITKSPFTEYYKNG